MNRTDMSRIFIKKKYLHVGAIFSKQKPAEVFTRSSFQLNLHLLMYLPSNQQAKELIITRT